MNNLIPVLIILVIFPKHSFGEISKFFGSEDGWTCYNLTNDVRAQNCLTTGRYPYKCFKAFDTKLNHFQAIKACEARGASLAQIYTATDTRTAYYAIKNIQKACDGYWTAAKSGGCYSDCFSYPNNCQIDCDYNNWYSHETRKCGQSEYAVALNTSNGKWYASVCQTPLHYICQRTYDIERECEPNLNCNCQYRVHSPPKNECHVEYIKFGDSLVISNTNLVNTSFNECVFRRLYINNCCLINTKFSRVEFEDVKLLNTDTNYVVIQNTRLINTNMNFCRMFSYVMNNSALIRTEHFNSNFFAMNYQWFFASDCSFETVSGERSDFKIIRYSKCKFDHVSVCHAFRRNYTKTNSISRHISSQFGYIFESAVKNSIIENTTLLDAVYKNSLTTNAHTNHCQFTYSEFAKTFFANTDVSNSSYFHVDYDNSGVIGSLFKDSDFVCFDFSNSTGNALSAKSSQFSEVGFKNLEFNDFGFDNACLKTVTLYNFRFDKASLRNVTLSKFFTDDCKRISFRSKKPKKDDQKITIDQKMLNQIIEDSHKLVE